MSITVVLGEQRGDEGKGRFVDMLAKNHDIVARFNGGNNAGHTVVLPSGQVLKLHLVPSGIAHSHTVNIIGNGTLINPIKLIEEIEQIKGQGVDVTPKNLLISSAAHLILPSHISADEIREAGKTGQGSTKSGIAQVSSDKYLRTGLRTETIKSNPDKLKEIIIQTLSDQNKSREVYNLNTIDLKSTTSEYLDACFKLTDYITDTVLYLNQKIKTDPKINILAEAAQAFLLDIDHGMYPYVTSSTTTSGGVATGLGVSPQKITKVLGVIKATQSHVGGGKFVTEILDNQTLKKLHGDMKTVDAECGTTTGRIRRLGHLDLPIIKRAHMINGTDEIAITKLDWLGRYGQKIPVCISYRIDGKKYETATDNSANVEPIYEELDGWTEDISGCRNFSELPKNAQKYIKFIEQKTGLPVKYIGVGPGREEVITR